MANANGYSDVPAVAGVVPPVYLGAVEEGGVSAGVIWLLKRNCSLSPRQMLWFYLSICVCSLGIASGFWSMGVWLVMPFAWLELAALGLALLVYARHAADRECLRLSGGQLTVERTYGTRVERATFHPDWVRVEVLPGPRALVRLSGQGQNISVGRYIRPELRKQLAQELKINLARAGRSYPVAAQSTAAGRDGSV